MARSWLRCSFSAPLTCHLSLSLPTTGSYLNSLLGLSSPLRTGLVLVQFLSLELSFPFPAVCLSISYPRVSFKHCLLWEIFKHMLVHVCACGRAHDCLTLYTICKVMFICVIMRGTSVSSTRLEGPEGRNFIFFIISSQHPTQSLAYILET